MSYRFLNQYRLLYKVPRLELCQFKNISSLLVDGVIPDDVEVPAVSIFNNTYVRSMANGFLKAFKNSSNYEMSPCPFLKNDLRWINESSSSQSNVIAKLPNGDYRKHFSFFNDDDKNVFTRILYERYLTHEDSWFWWIRRQLKAAKMHITGPFPHFQKCVILKCHSCFQ